MVASSSTNQLTPLEANVLSMVLFEESEKVKLLKRSLEERNRCNDSFFNAEGVVDLVNQIAQFFVSGAVELWKTRSYSSTAIKISEEKKRLIEEDVSYRTDRNEEFCLSQATKVKKASWRPLQLRLAEMIGASDRLVILISSSIEKRLVTKWESARIDQQLYMKAMEQNDIYNEYLHLRSLTEKEKLFRLQSNYLEHATDKLMDQFKKYENRYERRMEALENEANIIQNTLRINDKKLKALQATFQNRQAVITWAKKRENAEHYVRKIQRWWRELDVKRVVRPKKPKKRKPKKGYKGVSAAKWGKTGKY